MRCEKVLGNINDPSFEIVLRRDLGGAFETDEVLLDWDETRRRRLRKTSSGGVDVGICRGDEALGEPLADGDVLGTVAGPLPVVVVVRLRSAEAFLIEVDRADALALAHVCWEIGNMHAPLFRGDSDERCVRLLTPAMPVLDRMLQGVEGARVSRVNAELDQRRRFRTRASEAVVELASTFKIVKKGS